MKLSPWGILWILWIVIFLTSAYLMPGHQLNNNLGTGIVAAAFFIMFISTRGNIKIVMLIASFFQKNTYPICLRHKNHTIRYSIAKMRNGKLIAPAEFIMDRHTLLLENNGKVYWLNDSFTESYSITSWSYVKKNDKVLHTLKYGGEYNV